MITGFVQGQVLRLNAPVVAADTLDYLTAQFVFRSADWNGMEKWAHFAKGGTVYDIPLTDDKIRREDHLNLAAGEWKVYVHGNRFEGGKVVERITTAEDVLCVVPTGALNGEPFPEMPASVTEQILSRLDKVEQGGGGTGSGGVQVDDTLTKAGYAADAKETGGRITNLSDAIADKLDANKLTDAINTALSQAKESGEFDGEPGTTPHIGENGNWYIGDVDTGVKAQGEGGGAYVNNAETLYAAVSAGGVITIAPDADITVSQTLTLPEGTVILGNGATIRRAAGFEEGLFNLSSGCHLENFTIDGNRSAMINPTWNKTYEVNMKTDAQGCVVENITINNGNEGIIVSGYDNIVRGCKLYNLGGNGIHFGSAYRGRLYDHRCEQKRIGDGKFARVYLHLYVCRRY